MCGHGRLGRVREFRVKGNQERIWRHDYEGGGRNNGSREYEYWGDTAEGFSIET